MINKSATFIGTLEFTNGNSTAIYLGVNSNLGSAILWQKTVGRRAGKFTGRNIALVVKEIRAVLANGEAVWASGGADHNSLAWDALKKTAVVLA